MSPSYLSADDVAVDVIATNNQSLDPLDLPLMSETGSTISINSLEAPVRLVFFGFTYCPDVCPLTLHKVASALRLLDRPVEDIDVVFVSVDPKRDTPEILAQYTDAFHDQITGVSGNVDQLKILTEYFRTTFGYNIHTDAGDTPLPVNEYNTLPADTNYMPFHSSQIYVLDRNGEIVDLIGLGNDATLIAQIIENSIAL